MRNIIKILIVFLLAIANIRCSFPLKELETSNNADNEAIDLKQNEELSDNPVSSDNNENNKQPKHFVGIDLFPMMHKRSINAFYEYFPSTTWNGMLFIHKYGYNLDGIKWTLWEAHAALQWYWGHQAPRGGYLKVGVAYESGHINIENPDTHDRVSDWGIILGIGNIGLPRVGLDLFIRKDKHEWESADGKEFYRRKIEPAITIRLLGFAF